MNSQASQGGTAAMVTGASSGIGRACALALAAAGWRVFAGVRREEDGDALRDGAGGVGSIEPVILDVTEADSIARARDEIAVALGDGALRGLVNNAGIVVSGPLECVPVEALRRQLEINVVGQHAVTRAFLPLLRRVEGPPVPALARIVNIGSVSGVMAAPFLGPYAMSKFAMEAYSDALRVELKPRGIHVALIQPGPIATPIWEKARRESRGMLDGLPAEERERAERIYGPMLRMFEKYADLSARRAEPVEKVTREVLHALTAARPRTRYRIGRGSGLRMFAARTIPDRWRDAAIMRVLERLS